jgi:ADP-ribose pyrophosphatase YjhB (NUDIX family)
MSFQSIFRAAKRLTPVMASSARPRKPAVGVGVVILRNLIERPGPEVLLIRRGKAPSKGLISFPGGSQELGETVIECAIREAREECGIALKHNPSNLKVISRMGPNRIPQAFLGSEDLAHPKPFTAVDVISVDDEDASEQDLDMILFHYSIIEVAATLEEPRCPPIAGDDADDAFWMGCEELARSEDPDLVPNLKHVVQVALERFSLPKQ